MGLIKSLGNAVGGTLRDQYADFFYCEALDMNVLMAKGKRNSRQGSTNKATENVISDGSVVSIADGQCMIVVESGQVVDFSMEPGTYEYKTGTEPSMLTGGLEGLKKSFSEVGKRFVAGGMAAKDQRIYYINTKEIMGNKVGAGDIPFRDGEFGFTMKLRCFGEYSYKITDPLLFYKNVAGNVQETYTRDKIDSQFKAEIQTSLQPAFGRIAQTKIPYDELTLHTKEISKALNVEMTDEWVNKRGVSVSSFALASVTPDPESASKIEKFQAARIYGTDVRMMAGRMGEAQATAMETAAGNEGGPMNGFIGMGMAQNAGGMNAGQLFQMGQQQGTPNVEETTLIPPTEKGKNSWACPECGGKNTRKFCDECGVKKPEEAKGWTCTCGTVNTGKFCMDCGVGKPVELDSKCDNCGYEAPAPFKFCPDCGSVNK